MAPSTRRRFLQGGLALAGLGLLAGCAALPPAMAPGARIHRIGYLSGVPMSAIGHRTEAFRQGLRDLGYVEGKDLVIEWRSTEGQSDRTGELAAELVRLNVAVIVTAGPEPTRFAKQATAAIPIVMTQDDGPVGAGIVDSLARPGGNITGLSQVSPDLSGKRLGILSETVPGLARVAVFATPSSPRYPRTLEENRRAAAALGVTLQHVDVGAPEELDGAFRAAVQGRADGVLMDVAGPIATALRDEIAALVARHRLPVIYSRREYVDDGGLMSYGVSVNDLDRRAAIYVDKILKGTKPADLPVEQPTRFEFVINRRTADALGLMIPHSVLQQATEVIQ